MFDQDTKELEAYLLEAYAGGMPSGRATRSLSTLLSSTDLATLSKLTEEEEIKQDIPNFNARTGNIYNFERIRKRFSTSNRFGYCLEILSNYFTILRGSY